MATSGHGHPKLDAILRYVQQGQVVADLVKEGLLNPELAKTYLMRASKVANRGSELSLAVQLKRLSALGPITRPPQATPERAAGGRVALSFASGGFVGNSWLNGGPLSGGSLLGG